MICWVWQRQVYHHPQLDNGQIKTTRDKLNLKSAVDRDRLAGYWHDHNEVMVVLELAAVFRIKRFFYPEDHCLPFFGAPNSPWSRLKRHFQLQYCLCWGEKQQWNKTFREVVQELISLLCNSEVLKLAGPHPRVAPPPYPGSTPLLRELAEWHIERGTPPSQEALAAELKTRRPFDLYEFCACWPDLEAARIAIAIHNAAVFPMERQHEDFFFPEDPLLLLLLSRPDWDDLQTVEFLAELEKTLGIGKIPDSQAEALLYKYTFAEAVAYLRALK